MSFTCSKFNFRCLVALSFLAISPIQTQLRAQASVEAAEVMFLHLQASDANVRSSQGREASSFQDRASQLGIQADELTILDDAAIGFVNAERALRDEARQYVAEAEARGEEIDMDVVMSFSRRRESLARAAFNQLKGRISPSSDLSLRAFVNGRFRQSITSSTLTGRVF